ncbi:MAG: GNAT family N-acetyltransferase [Phycisphaerales bacterium]|nr:GNAT family N-acetyltransferase [Phycisphaerales bacterium]NNM27818.1 GNAT family N-acetyltransferase [Phycisphaerales bacterium]
MSSSQIDPDQLPPTAAGEIVRIGPDDRPTAIARLLGATPSRAEPAGADRFLAFAAANDVPLEDLWARVDGSGRILDCVLAVPNPGRTAVLFASPPATRESDDHLAAVIDRATGALVDRDVHLAQVLLEPHDRRRRRAFLAGGFTTLAQLSYLERALPPPRPTGAIDLPSGVTVRSYDEAADHADLVAILEASYEDTLDCPGLRGLRQTDDILTGHRETGEFDPALWSIARDESGPAGALLLNRAPASQTIELVYIGLAPRLRGCGIGRGLLRHGLHLVDERPERAVTLAVDERNEPALALYRREGFRRVLRRTALIRSLRSPGFSTEDHQDP